MERYKWVEIDGSSMMKQFPPGYSKERAETEVRLTRAMRDLGMEAAYPQKIVEDGWHLGDPVRSPLRSGFPRMDAKESCVLEQDGGLVRARTS